MEDAYLARYDLGWPIDIYIGVYLSRRIDDVRRNPPQYSKEVIHAVSCIGHLIMVESN